MLILCQVRYLFALSALVISFCCLGSAIAQEDKGSQAAESESDLTPADRVRMGNKFTLVISDPDVVMDDIDRLMIDMGFGSIATNYDHIEETLSDDWYRPRSGVFIYDSYLGNSPTIEFTLTDQSKLARKLKSLDLTEPADEAWFPFANSFPLPIPFPELITPIRARRGYVKDDRFLICDVNKKEEGNEVLESELLSTQLNTIGRDIINQSGLSIVTLDKDGSWLTTDGWNFDIGNPQDWTSEELDWLKKANRFVSHAQHAILGLKYHRKKFLELRATVCSKHSIDTLVDLSVLGRDWQPDLGLEPEQLVLAAALQMDAFRSSAPPRALPRLAARYLRGNDSWQFLQGNLVQALTELTADSWNDLTAARIALYENDDDEGAGRFALIGVVDARDSSQVLKELELLSQLTSPLMVGERAELRRDEIRRLVLQLGAEDQNLAARAETRLRLAGQSAAAECLQALESEYESQDRGTRRINVRIKQYIENSAMNPQTSTDGITNPWFWSTLNPGLNFREKTSTINGHTLHTIDITADPSRDEQEVTEANQVMAATFGPNWNRVQIVQIDNNFVFMLGSDQGLLQQVVANVTSKSKKLTDPMAGVGDGSAQGPLHLFLQSSRMRNLLRPSKPKSRPSDQLIWANLNISEQNLGVRVLAPCHQILPLVLGF